MALRMWRWGKWHRHYASDLLQMASPRLTTRGTCTPSPSLPTGRRAYPAVPDGGKKRASERRQDFYRKMSLCVRVQPDDLEVEIANLAISLSADPS